MWLGTPFPELTISALSSTRQVVEGSVDDVQKSLRGVSDIEHRCTPPPNYLLSCDPILLVVFHSRRKLPGTLPLGLLTLSPSIGLLDVS